MRIKILMAGNNPAALLADSQLLRDKGMLVYTCFNMENIHILIDEVHPDVVFFDPQKNSFFVAEAYNALLADIHFTQIPLIYTLAEDDVYLVTRKRTSSKTKRSLIVDNLIDAIKMALHNETSYPVHTDLKRSRTIPAVSFNARA